MKVDKKLRAVRCCNDVEKAFINYRDLDRDEARALARTHLPKLAEIVDATNDTAFVAFMQMVMDDFMINVCQLANSKQQIE